MSENQNINSTPKAERYVIASVWKRIGATLIDYAMFAGLTYLAQWLLTSKLGWVTTNADGSVILVKVYLLAVVTALIGGALIYLVPPIFFKNGKTIGKKIFGLQVISKDGKPITYFRLFFRFLVGFYFIEYITGTLMQGIPVLLIVSALFAYLNKHHQAFHDLVSGTLVVEDQKEVLTLKVEEDKEKNDKAKEENKATDVVVR